MAPTNKKKPEDQEPDDDGEADFTPAQLSKIGALINSTVSTQLGRKLDKAIEGAITPQLTKIQEMLAAKQPAHDPDEDEEVNDPPAKPEPKPKRRGPAPPDPAVIALQKKLETLEAERKQERETMAARERDGTLREHLTKGGVKPELMRGAISVIREATKRDEKTGEWFYTADKGDYQEDLDLASGAKHWLGTDEGKAHIAAPEKPRSGAGTHQRVIGAPATQMRAQPSNDPKAQKQAKIEAAYASLSEAAGALQGGGQG